MPIKTDIVNMLNEEKWTRTTLDSYTIKKFDDLDALLQDKESGVQEEILELCREHHRHNKNSIIALYLGGMILLQQDSPDDSYIVNLVNLFNGSHKGGIVRYLCEKFLSYKDNKILLRLLAERYAEDKETEKKIAAWEKLIRLDYGEVEIIRNLALYYEKNGNRDKAVLYFKKTLHRYIIGRSFTGLKEVWSKLLLHNPEDTDYFFTTVKKLSSFISAEKLQGLLKEMYETYTGREDWDTGIDILKTYLKSNSKDYWCRKEIIKCYRNKYKDHSHLDDYISLSNIKQGWRNIHEAINDFEKHISFDKGNFVLHKDWGVGLIQDINKDDLTIDFAKKRKHSMSVKMAVSALQSLSKNHIRVLKSIIPKEKLKEKFKANIPATLRIIIKSHENLATIKQIRAELVPGIFTASEWSSWSTQAKQILKTDPIFDITGDKTDEYTVRETLITPEEKLYNRFKGENDFFKKIEIAREFMESADEESEYFGEIFTYFNNLLKSGAVNAQVISSYIFASELRERYPFLPELASQFRFDELDDEAENLFRKITLPHIRDILLRKIRSDSPRWIDIYFKVVPIIQSKEVVNTLYRESPEQLKSFFQRSVEGYKENRDFFIWLIKDCSEEVWFKEIEMDREKIFLCLLYLLRLTHRDIESKKDVVKNRRSNKMVQNFLFKEKTFEHFILDLPQEEALRFYQLLSDNTSVKIETRLDLKDKLKEKFPRAKFEDDSSEGDDSRSSHTFMTFESSYKERQEQLRHLVQVEIPNNSQEIAKARELGDLKENAEYKAGKEQQVALNTRRNKLKEELDQAKIVDLESVSVRRSGFGTHIVLLNEKNEEESYSLLGPWESDPDRNILSYLSPFGGELLNRKKGDKLSFNINERDYRYTVLDIRKVSL